MALHVTRWSGLNTVLAMLGHFLEYAINVGDVGTALQFYRSVGFQDVPTADFITTPYAAVWDGAAVIGLNEGDHDVRMRFVRPSLQAYLPALRRHHLEIVDTELGDDVFNRLVFCDNAGHQIELLEARTCSLAERESGRIAACGQFQELSLPTHSVDDSANFWSALGFAVEAHESEGLPPRIRVTGSGLSLGYHQMSFNPGISFVAPDLAARAAYLRARGLRLTPVFAPVLSGSTLQLQTPESNVPLYLGEDR